MKKTGTMSAIPLDAYTQVSALVIVSLAAGGTTASLGVVIPRGPIQPSDGESPSMHSTSISKAPIPIRSDSGAQTADCTTCRTYNPAASWIRVSA